MNETSHVDEQGAHVTPTEREAIELVATSHTPDIDPHRVPANRAGFDRAAVEQRLRANVVTSGNGVTWVRMSDLISSGSGRIAGRGIDLEADLARRLRHPVDATRQAIRNRRASLAPLDAFGRSRSRADRDALGRS
ncbi:hypothetical protein [Microbacterium atlanticum]|uniref:hypothetical protein n=1 Tax=Microbacterium atlanticum TaxID=2782168 RepID=UPI00188899AC|nr:hypothetical protein [Microbacterium atlanticum]